MDTIKQLQVEVELLRKKRDRTQLQLERLDRDMGALEIAIHVLESLNVKSPDPDLERLLEEEERIEAETKINNPRLKRLLTEPTVFDNP